MLTAEEKTIANECLRMALDAGAQKARVTLSKSVMDLVSTLNGEVDKITGCYDRSITISIFADGRYGSFSTNKLSRTSLRDFIAGAVETVKMLAPDPCRVLPSPERKVKDALTGDELGLRDPAYDGMSAEKRRETALACALGSREGEGWKLISEEGEYSDSQYWAYLVDTEGLEALHNETSFEYWTEATIEDDKGDKYTGNWWEAAPLLKDFHPGECGANALRQAVAQIGPKPLESGKYNMVIDRDVASKVISPIIASLNANSIQQGNSFLGGSLGKQVFPQGMNLVDTPRIPGEAGSRCFDSEGVATSDRPIIENGVVKNYFVNSYMAAKTGLEPTLEDAIRPALQPWHPWTGNPVGKDEIMRQCGSGILVTEFNGGNSNPATGDFSYGIQGFFFRDGKPVHPVSEVLVTGNFKSLWAGLLAAGDDARRCMVKLVPTLAFKDVDFSG